MDLFRPVRLGQVPLVTRPVFHRRRYLGQEANRLLGMQMQFILQRREVALAPYRPIGVSGGYNPFEGTGWPMSEPGFPFQPGEAERRVSQMLEWPPDVVANIVAMTRNASDEELEDAAFIDSFFGAPGTSQFSKTIENCRTGGLIVGEQPTMKRTIPIDFGPFLCPPLDLELFEPQRFGPTYQDILRLQFLNYEPTSHSQWRSFPLRMIFWQVNPEMTWGEVKPYVDNMYTIERTIRSYPWPTGLREFPGFWVRLVLPELRELAKTPGLNEDFVRFWITMSIVANSQKFAEEIADYADDQAHKDKIRARMNLIAGLALGAMFAVFAPVLVAQGFSAIQQGLTIMQKREAAVELERAAEQMESKDSAFAGELQHASDVMEFFAAEAARVGERAKSAEELAQEVESAVGGPSVGDIAIIGAVGVALAVGIGYLVTEVL